MIHCHILDHEDQGMMGILDRSARGGVDEERMLERESTSEAGPAAYVMTAGPWRHSSRSVRVRGTGVGREHDGRR